MNKKIILLFFLAILLIGMFNFISSATWNSTFNNSLVAYYSMDEGAGTTTAENVFGILNMSLVTSPTWVTNGKQYNAINNTLEAGSNCLQNTIFDGLDGLSAGTISFWINVTGVPDFVWCNEGNCAPLIVGHINPPGFFIAILQNLSIAVDKAIANWEVEVVTGSQPISLGIWYHIVAVYNGTDTKVYINGTLSSSGTASANTFYPSGGLDLLGWSVYPIGATATMDEVAIWNRSLSAEEIASLYDAGAGTFYSSTSNIILTSPINNTITNNPNQTFIINWIGLDNLTFFLWDATGAEVLTPSILDLTGDYSNSSNFSYNFSFPYVDDGTYYWNSLGNDTIWANNGNFTFILDTTFPLIDITYPINNTNFTDGRIDVNYTVSDIYLSNCWYSNDTYLVNTSLTDCGTNITEIIWDEGQHDVTIWANDSVGNENSSKISFTIDFFPNILIVFPTNNTNSTDINLDINYTSSDNIGLDSCWYSNDTYLANTSLTDCGTNITEIIWDEGQHDVTIWVNDGAGNENHSNIYFTIDTINPDILIVFPTNNTNFTTGRIDVNYTVSDIYLSNCWYSNDTYLANTSLTDCGTNITEIIWDEGQHDVTIWANDSVGNENYSAVTFFVDTIAPNIQIITPTNGTNTTNAELNINYTVENGYISCWYSNDSNTINVTLPDCITNITTVTWSEGQHNVTIWVNDTYGNENHSDIYFTVDTTFPLMNITYPINNTNFTTGGIDVNYIASDSVGLDSCWYSNDSYSVNVTLANCSTNITTITWALGQHNVTIWVNDSAGNENYSAVTFNISVIIPPSSTSTTSGMGGGCAPGYKLENGKCLKVENKTQIPSQLFDIKLELENTAIKNSSELTSVIRFESFGNVSTPVDLTYKILDSSGIEVYSEKGNVVVTTEQIVRKNFENLNLKPGKYTLTLTTLYNKNISDIFRQEFEIKDTGVFSSLVNMTMSTLIAVITIVVFIVCFLSYKIYRKKITGHLRKK